MSEDLSSLITHIQLIASSLDGPDKRRMLTNLRDKAWEAIEAIDRKKMEDHYAARHIAPRPPPKTFGVNDL